MTPATEHSNLRDRLQEILPHVTKPSRYIGGELNSIVKPIDSVNVRVALAFPDIYEVGMSNLGLQILYHVLNAMEDVCAERVFAPAQDMRTEMRRSNLPLFSLESTSLVKNFDIVGFSLAYELTYTTVLEMLDLAGIPLRSTERDESDPIVIAGGHCATNPEPMAEFIDAFVIGDGEEVVLEIAEAIRSHKGNRSAVLRALSKTEGVYVPAIGTPAKISARRVTNLERTPYPVEPVVPHTEIVHDRAAVEIMRGCTRGCRFCQAGMITRPVRERSLSTLVRQASEIIANTGYDEIALTSLSSADYSQIDDLVKILMDTFEPCKVGVSLPSLRADAECVRLASEIQRVRKSGLTFAPEAGTQRLRNVINKNVSEEDLLRAVSAAVEAGWRRVKLYFMIGLPTETEEDIVGIAELVNKVLEVGKKHGKPMSISLTISPFVPKPHTPFQWRGMTPPEELERRISALRKLIRSKNVVLNWHDPAASRIEAALARGDRAVGKVIYESWARGGYLEQDYFEANRWLEAFDAAGLKIDDYANRLIPYNEPLPWDHIDTGVSKSFLISEDKRAARGETTPDCRWDGCVGCGLRCPSPTTEQAYSPVRPAQVPGTQCQSSRDDISASKNFWDAFCVFEKRDQARWLGHLDVARAFERAVRMSGLNVEYSQGFNPRPRISFPSALPLGATGENELVTIRLKTPYSPQDFMDAINSHLPTGIRVVSTTIRKGSHKLPTIRASEYLVTVDLPEGTTLEDAKNAVNQLMSLPVIVHERHSNHKMRTIDLRSGIESLTVCASTTAGGSVLRMILPQLDFAVKPSEVVECLCNLLPGIRIRSIHRKRLITKEIEHKKRNRGPSTNQ